MIIYIGYCNGNLVSVRASNTKLMVSNTIFKNKNKKIESRFFGEIADSRTGARNIENELEESSARKQENVQKQIHIMEKVCYQDLGTNWQSLE